MLGRSAEFDAVRQHLASPRAGACGLVVIEGEAGIGKTRFVAEVLAEAAGFRVFNAVADELECTRPFGSLVDALDCRRSSADPLRAEIARLIDEAAAEFRIVERVSELLEQMALAEPLVVAIDDLQWADSSTVTALRFANRQLCDVPATFVVALRPVPRSDALAGFLDSSLREGALHVILGPLDEHAVAELVEDRLGLPPGPGLQSLVATAAGNPFYVTELVEALTADGRLHTAHGSVDADPTSTPVAFRSAVVRYLRFLGEPQLTLLRWAAVLGSRFSPADLATVSGTAVGELLPVLDEAVKAGILIDDRGRLAFRHDLLRSALYDDMGTAVRQSLHLEAARALGAEGAAPLEVAHHVLRGPRATDPAAVEMLLAAAHQTIHLGTKVELLNGALERLPAHDSRLVDIAGKAIVTLGRTGRVDDAEALAAGLRPNLAEGDRARLSAALAAAYSHQSDPAGVLRHCDAIKDKATLPARARTMLRTNEAFGLFLAQRVDDAEVVARRAIEDGTRSGDRETVAAGTGVVCFCTLARGQGRDTVATAIDVAKHWPPYGEFILEMSLINEDRLAEAEELFASAHQRITERGQLTVQLMFQAAHARAALLAGRLDDAATRSEAALSLAEQADVPVPTAVARGVLARVALHRGSITVAKTTLGPGHPAPGLGVDIFEWAKALIVEAEGEPARARRSLAAAWYKLAPLRYAGTWQSIGPDLVRLHIAEGDHNRAVDVTEAVEAGAAGSNAVSATGAALRCRALVEHDRTLIRQAISTYETGPRVLDTARAREDAATLIDGAEAVEQLRTALVTYEAADASGDITRVRSALRARGVRLGTRGTRQRPTTGWDSLTPTEHKVVALAAGGLTTRQIGDRLYISSFTVGSHLRHVYQKLGINSRARLTAEAIRRGTGGRGDEAP